MWRLIACFIDCLIDCLIDYLLSIGLMDHRVIYPTYNTQPLGSYYLSLNQSNTEPSL